MKTRKSERDLPVPLGLDVEDRGSVLAIGFSGRVRALPFNPGNALRRVVRPVAKELGIQLGGWHDSHNLSTMMRRNKVHPKVISGTLGHSKVEFTSEVYDHASVEEMREPLPTIVNQLLPSVTKRETVN